MVTPAGGTRRAQPVIDGRYGSSSGGLRLPASSCGNLLKKSPSRLRGRGQMEQSLYGDTRNRLAPVGVTGLRHGTSLKNVARTGIQTGDDHWCLDCGESFVRP